MQKSIRSVQKYNNNNGALFTLKHIYMESDKKKYSDLRYRYL